MRHFPDGAAASPGKAAAGLVLSRECVRLWLGSPGSGSTVSSLCHSRRWARPSGCTLGSCCVPCHSRARVLSRSAKPPPARCMRRCSPTATSWAQTCWTRSWPCSGALPGECENSGPQPGGQQGIQSLSALGPTGRWWRLSFFTCARVLKGLAGHSGRRCPPGCQVAAFSPKYNASK